MIAKVTNLHKILNGQEVINDISFSLAEGTINAILGPNGVGKTTTIRLLTGLLHPTKGAIEVFGTPTTNKNFDRIRMQMGVQNDGNLYESLTVYENLKIWAKFYNVPKSQIEPRIEQLLEYFSLNNRKNSKVGTLSKGMKQKVAIIRAMIHNPKLLILDEPTSGLDPSAAEDLICYLQKIVDEMQMTVFMCTHQLQGLEKIADNIFIMYDGQFISSGSTEVLLNKEWPRVTFDILTGHPDKCKRILNELKFVIVEEVEEEKGNLHKQIRISLENKQMITKIIETLVYNKIDIYSVKIAEHDIKELYFKKIGEVQDGKY
ncbi:ABC transporter ATP-binding protein [Staphylococcus coagulans]|uniref:ABC transporter ATP-binding protein n=1 Tax=Staphylococcus coagulans TaxID=74706 RepID=UPI0015F7BC4D|nr:ABC transporter ATP-binding protein [Staphylococcus coagulans]MBA8762308.1 ATP-binding cassette domain-containing protein [Staphylococcus coagulans]